jgi:uncharacterized protein (TIGR02996 family)
MGGMPLLTGNIVRVVEARGGRELYRHPNYHERPQQMARKPATAASFVASLRALDSPKQQARRDAAWWSAHASGIEPHVFHDALHDHPRGTTPSVVHHWPNAPDEGRAHYAAAWFGLLTGLEAVGVFYPSPDGPDRLTAFSVPKGTSGADLRMQLDQAGIGDRVLIPQDGGFRVLVFDPGGKLTPVVEKFAQANGYGAVSSAPGTGTRLGGSEPKSARAAYRNLIKKFESKSRKARAGLPRRYALPMGFRLTQTSGGGRGAERSAWYKYASNKYGVMHFRPVDDNNDGIYRWRESADDGKTYRLDQMRQNGHEGLPMSHHVAGWPLTPEEVDAIAEHLGQSEPPDWRPNESMPEDFYSASRRRYAKFPAAPGSGSVWVRVPVPQPVAQKPAQPAKPVAQAPPQAPLAVPKDPQKSPEGPRRAYVLPLAGGRPGPVKKARRPFSQEYRDLSGLPQSRSPIWSAMDRTGVEVLDAAILHTPDDPVHQLARHIYSTGDFRKLTELHELLHKAGHERLMAGNAGHNTTGLYLPAVQEHLESLPPGWQLHVKGHWGDAPPPLLKRLKAADAAGHYELFRAGDPAEQEFRKKLASSRDPQVLLVHADHVEEKGEPHRAGAIRSTAQAGFRDGNMATYGFGNLKPREYLPGRYERPRRYAHGADIRALMRAAMQGRLQGDHSAQSVLADYMEENRHPMAPLVRHDLEERQKGRESEELVDHDSGGSLRFPYVDSDAIWDMGFQPSSVRSGSVHTGAGLVRVYPPRADAENLHGHVYLEYRADHRDQEVPMFGVHGILPRAHALQMLRDLAREHPLHPIVGEGGYRDDQEARAERVLGGSVNEEARQFAKMKSPPGGMISRGMYYPGGEFLPDWGEPQKKSPESAVEPTPKATRVYTDPVTGQGFRRESGRLVLTSGTPHGKIQHQRVVVPDSNRGGNAMTVTEADPRRYAATDGLAIQRGVEENPDDKAAKLVLADWLEENGHPDEARVYRLAGSMRWDHDPEALASVHGITTVAFRRAGLYGEVPARHFGNQPESWEGAARRMLAWFGPHEQTLRRAQAAIDREHAWAEKARGGDVTALLAHPGSRAAVRVLAESGNSPRRGDKPSDYTTSRKAIQIAKARLQDRVASSRAFREAEAARVGTPGRIKTAWIDKMKGLAVKMAEDYHKSVRSLYRSSRASVAYGRGGQEQSEYVYGGAWKGRPARWQNAGARLDNEDRPTHVIIENHLGNVVDRLPLPGPARDESGRPVKSV